MEQDLPTIDSLFDFIYLDRPRFASYFAQIFDEGGVLTGVKDIRQNQDMKSVKLAGNAFLARADVSGQESAQESIERQFSTDWSVPLNVINRLDECSFIKKEVDAVDVGQFVLVSGRISLVDIKMLKQMWKPALSLMLGNLPASTPAQKKQKQAEIKILEQLFALMEHLPDMAQLSVKSLDNNVVWTTLSPEHLIVSPGEIALKYGGHFSGVWHLLGILDAKPDEFDHSSGTDYQAGLSGLFAGAMEMMTGIRAAIGRPGNAYGVTPVAIFRSIKQAQLPMV